MCFALALNDPNEALSCYLREESNLCEGTLNLVNPSASERANARDLKSRNEETRAKNAKSQGSPAVPAGLRGLGGEGGYIKAQRYTPEPPYLFLILCRRPSVHVGLPVFFPLSCAGIWGQGACLDDAANANDAVVSLACLCLFACSHASEAKRDG